MPRKGGKRKKNRTHVAEANGTKEETIPKSFVFKRGKVPPAVQELVQDMRKVMSPYTARNLKEKKSNSIKDFVRVAAPMGITHFAFFSSTEKNTNLKIARIPRGPTLSFKVMGFSLMRQVREMQKRPMDVSVAFRTCPLVVLNNFGSDKDHVKLLNVTFQNMFPPLDVQSVKLSDCRRVILFNYMKETGYVEFRQYAIKTKATGLSRSMKQIVHSKIPDLSKVEDISDFVTHGQMSMKDGNCTSDSEDDAGASQVVLPKNYGGNSVREKSAIRLNEIGPRMTLNLIKVEKELCDGDVLYHSYIQKSTEDNEKDRKKHEEARALKKQRREVQQENVQRKKEIQQAKIEAKQEKRKEKQVSFALPQDEEDISDSEYFRQEVGEDPANFLFPKDKKQGTKRKISEKL